MKQPERRQLPRISSGNGIIDKLAITEAAEKAGGHGQDADDWELHCGIGGFLTEEINLQWVQGNVVGEREAVGCIERDGSGEEQIEDGGRGLYIEKFQRERLFVLRILLFSPLLAMVSRRSFPASRSRGLKRSSQPSLNFPDRPNAPIPTLEDL